MATDKKNDWANMVEEGDDDVDEYDPKESGEQRTESTKVLEDGTKVITEFLTRDGSRYKVVRHLRQSKKEKKIYKSAEERQARWKRFGKATNNTAEVTVVSEAVRLEIGKKEELKKSKIDKDFDKIYTSVAAGSGTFVASKIKDTASGSAMPPSEENKNLFVAAGRGAAAPADGRPQRDDSCTVRITNLSEDISEDDLRDLFKTYGTINRSYVAVDRVTKERRGFAFITFRQREDAAMAIEKLNRFPYKYVILNVGWAKQPAQR